MGVVYLARQESLGREVAVKLIRRDQLHLANSRARFRREVEAVARMKHPAIVPVYAVGEEGGIPYFAMERIDGVSMQDLLDELRGTPPASIGADELRRALPSSSASGSSPDAPRIGSWRVFVLSVARDIASALEHAHERGVLHRDVKPSNILVDARGHAFLVDFGLATTDEPGELTRTGSRLGSLPYMSPEQVRGEAADPRTDVYGLGAATYEMLTPATAVRGRTGGAPPHENPRRRAAVTASMEPEPVVGRRGGLPAHAGEDAGAAVLTRGGRRRRPRQPARAASGPGEAGVMVDPHDAIRAAPARARRRHRARLPPPRRHADGLRDRHPPLQHAPEPAIRPGRTEPAVRTRGDRGGASRDRLAHADRRSIHGRRTSYDPAARGGILREDPDPTPDRPGDAARDGADPSLSRPPLSRPPRDRAERRPLPSRRR